MRALRPGGARNLAPPLARHSVQAEPGVVPAPMQQLRGNGGRPDEAERNREIRATVATDNAIEGQKIKRFVNSKLPHHVSETVEKNGLKSAEANIVVGAAWDQDALKPAPLPEPIRPANPIAPPQLAQIGPVMAQWDPREHAELSQLAKRLEGLIERLHVLDAPERHPEVDPHAFKLPSSPERKFDVEAARQRITTEMNQIADQIGEKIGQAYRTRPQREQDTFAVHPGGEFKEQLWAMLRFAAPKLPPYVYKGPDADFGRYPRRDISHAKCILDRITLSARTGLSNHVVPKEGEAQETPDIMFKGALYHCERELGKGGAGVALLYKNDQGDAIVVKVQKETDVIGTEETRVAFEELGTHLALMGENNEGHPQLLGLKGVVIHPSGYPMGIMELAGGGDVDGLIGVPQRANQPPATDLKHTGTLGAACRQGLVSPQAAHLVKLVVLQQALLAMARFQEELGAYHGDFKPGNLLLSADGQLKLADFGTAQLLLEKEQTGPENGTVAYQAPEIHLNEANRGGTLTAKADTWSIGVMAHHLFKTGLPFNHENQLKIGSVVAEYGQKGATEEGRAYLSKLGENYDRTEMVQGVSATDRLVNAMLHPDPTKRPALSEVLKSSLFHDLGHGENDLTPKVQELIAALQSKPQDPALIKQKSDALGI